MEIKIFGKGSKGLDSQGDIGTTANKLEKEISPTTMISELLGKGPGMQGPDLNPCSGNC